MPRTAARAVAERQVRAVALLAQVEQDQVPDRAPARPVEDRRDELGPLRVREVAAVAQVPRDQGGRPARAPLHLDVVVELDAQQVDVGSRSAIAGDQLPVSAR